MGDNIPTYKEVSEELNSENPETQIPNFPIMENPELYTVEDMIDMWVRGCTNGATLWKFCQEHEKSLPSSFEVGLELLALEVRKTVNPASALSDLTSNNFMLLGVFNEMLGIDNVS
jgi:hypothetical protein